MIQSVPIILDIKQKVRPSYLCTYTLFAVPLCNLLVELYSIIWIKKKKKESMYFFKWKKKVSTSFTYCSQAFKCIRGACSESNASHLFPSKLPQTQRIE